MHSSPEGLLHVKVHFDMGAKGGRSRMFSSVRLLCAIRSWVCISELVRDALDRESGKGRTGRPLHVAPLNKVDPLPALYK